MRVDGEDFSGDTRGLRCPKCGGREFRVVYTRPMTDGTIDRRRKCVACGNRVTTREAVRF